MLRVAVTPLSHTHSCGA